MLDKPTYTIRRTRRAVAIASLSVYFGLTACANNLPSSTTYNTSETATLQEVKFATVVSVREVMIQQNSGETGKLAGGIIGGVAGSELGEGKGSLVGGLAGAVAGGTIGGLIDRTIEARQGVELTLRLENDKIVAIVQLADQTFEIGDKVKIISSQGRSRVTH